MFDDQDIFSVTQVEGYCVTVAKAVADELSSDLNDLYNYCSLNEIQSILQEKCLGHNESNEPLINSEVHINIMESVLQRVQNVAIAKLASEGFLECAWDEELNDMVFWLNDSKQ